jgi:hypothetical protein
VAVLRSHVGSSYHVMNAAYSCERGGRITQMSDFCCILQLQGSASGIIGLFTACGVECHADWLEIPPTPGFEVGGFCHGERRREPRK